MPQTGEEETGRQHDDCGAEPERCHASKADQIEAGADGGREQDEVRERAVGVGQPKRLAADPVIEQGRRAGRR